MAREIDLTSFLNGSNAVFLEQLYSSYIKDPMSVDASWRSYFQSLGDEAQYVLKQAVGASWAPKPSMIQGPVKSGPVAVSKPTSGGEAGQDIAQQLDMTVRVHRMIRAYRARGHLGAHLDPLNIMIPGDIECLNIENYGFTNDDLGQSVYVGGELGFEWATLGQVLDRLKQIYCGSVGAEFMHIHNGAQRDWLLERFENRPLTFNATAKKDLMTSLSRAEDFEKFLSVKFPGAKRFGLEGGESTIPCLEWVINDAVAHGVQDIVIGMSHRGRLNVLGNILQMGYEKILAEFQPHEDVQMQGSGDVKYHLGVSLNRTILGKDVHLSLTANPSHLEAVDPVVIGKVRAKQTRLKDEAREKVMGIMLHGDAAFAGQGIVAETLMMSELRGYKTGGTIHIIINNQIGFTTSPHMSRSSPYCSDGAKGIQAPVLHVNGDDPEAVVYVAQVASEFRRIFKKDIVIDLYCYRRHGHNEIDEPSFTQPQMYERIRQHPTTKTLYGQKLVGEGVYAQGDLEKQDQAFNTLLQSAFEKAKTLKFKDEDWLEGAWAGITPNFDLLKSVPTGIKGQAFDKIAMALTAAPKDFKVHPRLQRVLDEKAKNLNAGTNLDWATGEALAFGSLLLEGYPVRLSGQDVGRGTFSQRHAIIYDQESNAPYVFLNHVDKAQATAEIIDSPLSEEGVLGFDLGYSLADPKALVLWEAQFGDFANGAQMIVDQFISAGEAKWLRMSGLVMLLPHGYEGQGPEHSSARPERYLQLCAEDNMQVCNITTPANYFHALRRQLIRNTRKPLIIMTPKSLLRHKLAVSSKADFLDQNGFTPLIPDATVTKPKDIKRIIFCTGKVYYDLYEAREASKQKDIALVRLEQIYPFPHGDVVKVLKDYGHAEVYWCQEEPKNMGAWFLVDGFLEKAMIECKRTDRPKYVGRKESASTATGSGIRHANEQETLVAQALSVKK